MTEPVSRRDLRADHGGGDRGDVRVPRRLCASPAPTRIRVGLVGCGGRGTGAARDCLRGAEGVELVAMGDLLPDRLDAVAGGAREGRRAGSRLRAEVQGDADERCFTRLRRVQKVLASDVDLVILATPPGFRPAHLAAAVAAGKHIFTEKPVAVDSAGVRSVLATDELAKQKRLGDRRRHAAPPSGRLRRDDQAPPRRRDRRRRRAGRCSGTRAASGTPSGSREWTDTEWQIRNWLYFTWLSGDHIVEQHVHNIDVANWVMGAHPVQATGRRRPAVAHRAEVRPHLRSLRGRLRVPERRARA